MPKRRRCVYWEDEEWERIKQFAKRQGVSTSDVIRMAAAKYLSEKEAPTLEELRKK